MNRSNAVPWSVTATNFTGERHWGVRFEWIGMGYVLAFQFNPAPSCRVILFGWSVYFGRVLDKPKTIHYDLGEIAASKGWKHVRSNDVVN